APWCRRQAVVRPGSPPRGAQTVAHGDRSSADPWPVGFDRGRSSVREFGGSDGRSCRALSLGPLGKLNTAFSIHLGFVVNSDFRAGGGECFLYLEFGCLF